MSYKRSRATFETDLQKQESPYVVFGTPLPPLESGARDDGSFVPLWEQEVRDERGRKRLHGAFTGGFSAGYYNTVGSKEGWTPSTFVSSRSNRKNGLAQAQRPEDFMDDEDLAEAEEAKQLKTASGFTGLGGTEEDQRRRGGLLDLFRPSEDTIGIKLLQKMGWKEGQGIGPKILRKANPDSKNGSDHSDSFIFAPPNTKIISFIKKHDQKGLGFTGEPSFSQLKHGQSRPEPSSDTEEEKFEIRPKTKPPVPVRKQGAFGTGVLNDTGSDEEDPYEVGPRVSYSRVIGSDKKKAKTRTSTKPYKSSANPLLAGKPVFIKGKVEKAKALGETSRRCHDGRLPLEGFILAIRSTPPQTLYPPLKLPPGWVSKFAAKDTVSQDQAQHYKSTAETAKASSLKPADRANILGEQELPGKSVFDFLSPAARERLAKASGRNDLPAARNETLPPGSIHLENISSNDLINLLPQLDKDSALAALSRAKAGNGNGVLPYSDNEAKKNRYATFLELKSGIRDILPERTQCVTIDDYLKEMAEFAQVAKVFRPMSNLMASRFTSSAANLPGNADDDHQALLASPTKKPKDPAEEAASMGMYGSMTRQVLHFFPNRLLCKRFNVPSPAHIPVDSGDDGKLRKSATAQQSISDLANDIMPSNSAVRPNVLGGAFVSAGTEGGSKDAGSPLVKDPISDMDKSFSMPKPAFVDIETNEALEQARPGEDIFKAIFGNDDEED